MADQNAPAKVLSFEKQLRVNLEVILDSMPVAVSWANLETQEILYLNRTFTEMFGYVPGDHRTVTDWIEQTYVNPDHVQRAADMWYPHFGTDSIEPISIDQVEVDVLCKDQSVKTTLLGGMIMPKHGWALATFVDITERKHAEDLAQRMALEDTLTGLANRRAFNDMMNHCIARAQRSRSCFGLLLLDLDGFKEVNDTFGHANGDIALQAVAANLGQGIRSGDHLYRLGGDEFAVLAEGISYDACAGKVAERLIRAVNKPIQLEDAETELGISIGIAIFPTDAEDERSLYQRADQALYRAKEKGRGGWSR